MIVLVMIYALEIKVDVFM